MIIHGIFLEVQWNMNEIYLEFPTVSGYKWEFILSMETDGILLAKSPSAGIFFWNFSRIFAWRFGLIFGDLV